MKPLFRRLVQLGAHIGETVHSTNHFADYYVLGSHNSYYIIDISKTVIMLRYAVRFVRNSSSAGCTMVMYYHNTSSYEVVTLFPYKLSRVFPLNILYQKWIPGSISNYYSCFYDSSNEIQDLNWVDMRKKISFMNIFFRLLYYISIDRPVDITLEDQYKKSLSYWRAALFFRYFRNYYYLPDIALCIDSAYSNRISQEFSSLGIPVSAPLNTKSNFHFVSYPIISNNSSILLGLFYLSLFSSTILDGRRTQYRRMFNVYTKEVIENRLNRLVIVLQEYYRRRRLVLKQKLLEEKKIPASDRSNREEDENTILNLLTNVLARHRYIKESDEMEKKDYIKGVRVGETNKKQPLVPRGRTTKKKNFDIRTERLYGDRSTPHSSGRGRGIRDLMSSILDQLASQKRLNAEKRADNRKQKYMESRTGSKHNKLGTGVDYPKKEYDLELDIKMKHTRRGESYIHKNTGVHIHGKTRKQVKSISEGRNNFNSARRRRERFNDDERREKVLEILKTIFGKRK